MSQPAHILKREPGGGLFLTCSECPNELFLGYEDHDMRLKMKGHKMPVVPKSDTPMRDPMEEN